MTHRHSSLWLPFLESFELHSPKRYRFIQGQRVALVLPQNRRTLCLICKLLVRETQPKSASLQPGDLDWKVTGAPLCPLFFFCFLYPWKQAIETRHLPSANPGPLSSRPTKAISGSHPIPSPYFLGTILFVASCNWNNKCPGQK